MHSELPLVRPWVLGLCLALALFVCGYAASLAFVYIEGDDTTSIAYHALGRVAALQPPYTVYQSMMDALRRTVPAHEPILRMWGMLIRSLFAALLVCLIALLAVDWTSGLPHISAWAAVILIRVLDPEFNYLGLVYTPALIVMSAALASHLIWGAAAIVTWALMVAASGYGPAIILRTIRIAGPDNQYQNLLVTGATTTQTQPMEALGLTHEKKFTRLGDGRRVNQFIALL